MRDTTWKFIVSDWARLQKTLAKSKSFDFIPIYLSQVISTEDYRLRFEELFGPLEHDPVLERNIAIGRADIAARIAWRQREERSISEWLSKRP
jgi:hypothetical protein